MPARIGGEERRGDRKEESETSRKKPPILSTSEETDKERERMIDTVQQVQRERETHAGSSSQIQRYHVHGQLYMKHTRKM